ncbi:hypothetical protein B0H66DRAFT_554664 [Apodospora peruviana]|uniref:Serine/threonine-protein kinase ppk6 n=1 Tax=Apodospora peruviana TaxID=516989 RepID=A0AAE0ICH7_9PEZI|nr:hypothetical protein B0H66DRAFT_554664 [Apodospora peruviana]
MSADLFAAFESAAPASVPQQNQAQSGASSSVVAPSDPFSFLSSTTSTAAAPQPQSSRQQPSPWMPTLAQTASPVSSWSAVQSNQPQNANVWGDLGALAGLHGASSQKPAETEDEDDAWGDFEAPEDLLRPPAVPEPKPKPARTRIVRASTIDLFTNKLVDVGTTATPLESWAERPSWEAPVQKVTVQRPAHNPDPNILFDAADFELQGHDDDDDFGDFETDVAPPPPVTISAVGGLLAANLSAPSKPVDLLADSLINATTEPRKQPPTISLTKSTGTGNNGPLYPQAPKSPYGSFQNRKPDPMKELKVKTPQASEFPIEVKQPQSPTPVTAWPVIDDEFENDWPEFEDLPEDTKPAAAPKPTSKEQEVLGKLAAVTKATANISLSEGPVGPPPTNIPPPSVLLSIFPQLLDLATTSLLKPISSLPASSQQLVASNAATLIFLRGHLALATVAARIMAGRKLRWHRDKFLLQGMAISAATGGKGGMKLAGIDKMQSAREDREAAEVMAVWKQQVGRLRSAVTAANSAANGSSSVPLKIPELSLNVSAHAAANVVTAPKPCVICGLKRDERIAKVDFDVEDSFGEWWVEFWGHRACRNFWLEHEVKLRQR